MRNKTILICGPGTFHHEIADRLQRVADNMTTPVHIVTTDDIEQLAGVTNKPLEDILSMIEQLAMQKRSAGDDLESICLKAGKAFNEFSEAAAPFIDNDNRPWYDRAANKGGKKRKQNYNNRQLWRK